jgi:hypothetical protein
LSFVFRNDTSTMTGRVVAQLAAKGVAMQRALAARRTSGVVDLTNMRPENAMLHRRAFASDVIAPLRAQFVSDTTASTPEEVSPASCAALLQCVAVFEQRDAADVAASIAAAAERKLAQHPTSLKPQDAKALLVAVGRAAMATSSPPVDEALAARLAAAVAAHCAAPAAGAPAFDGAGLCRVLGALNSLGMAQHDATMAAARALKHAVVDGTVRPGDAVTALEALRVAQLKNVRLVDRLASIVAVGGKRFDGGTAHELHRAWVAVGALGCMPAAEALQIALMSAAKRVIRNSAGGPNRRSETEGAFNDMTADFVRLEEEP